jgi:deoxyribonuclease-4
MLPDSDFKYAQLLKALKERRAKGMVVCESVPYLEQDALLLQQTYRELL